MSISSITNRVKFARNGPTLCVRNGDAIILDTYKWVPEVNDWIEIKDWSTSGIEFAYFCEECYEGVKEDIGKTAVF